MRRAAAAHGARDGGVVLLNALIIISVVAAIATSLVRSGLEGRNRYALMQRSDQAHIYARAAEALAAELLAQDSEANETDHLGEAWAEDRGTLTIEGATLTATLTDLQGRLNVNQILRRSVPSEEGAPVTVSMSEPEYDLLRQLIEDAGGPDTLALRVAEWLAPSIDGLPGPVGDVPYQRGDAPYLRPAAPVLSVRDLRLVEGMEAPVMAALETSVAALPGETALNINTAPRPVLQALMPGLSPVQMSRFLAHRAETPFAARSDFESYAAKIVSPATMDALAALDIDVKTNWFLLETQVDHELGRARLFSIILRPDGGGRATVHLRSGAPL
ncbi:MAG: type II secretion system minor pseudopilin GspK [Pseudomonadota bacterium]